MLQKDYCLDGDNSPSYYDHTCVGKTHAVASSLGDSFDTGELRSAYLYSLDHGLITSGSADLYLYSKITRKELAKIITIYANNIV